MVRDHEKFIRSRCLLSSATLAHCSLHICFGYSVQFSLKHQLRRKGVNFKKSADLDFSLARYQILEQGFPEDATTMTSEGKSLT